MSLGLNSLAITVLFLLPGFIATSVRLSRTPARPAKQSAFQETLTSLSMSIIIFLVQLAILAFLLLLFSDIEKEFITAIDIGFSQYATTHPTRSLFTIVIWGLLVLTLSIFAGFLEPVERIALFNQRKLGVLEHDLWFDVFMAAPQRHGFSRCYLRAWHKDGACYAGWLETFELTSEDEKTRFFWLLEAQRWKTHDEANMGEAGEFIQGVLLQSNDIESIDVWWGDGPRSR